MHSRLDRPIAPFRAMDLSSTRSPRSRFVAILGAIATTRDVVRSAQPAIQALTSGLRTPRAR